MSWAGNQCPSGKHCFVDKRRAEGHLTNARKRHSGYRGEVYRCRTCGHWHVGRTRQEVRRDQQRQKKYDN